MSRPRLHARLLTAATVALLAGTAPALAQQPGSRQTRDFVQAAAQSDQFEILEAESALAASQDPGIQAFAHEMIKDHQRTSATLVAAATHSGLEPPQPGIGSDQSAFLAALQSLRGAEFDKAYARQQVLAHRAALAVEQIYARSGDDARVRQAAAAALPLIRAHGEMADRLAARLGAS